MRPLFTSRNEVVGSSEGGVCIESKGNGSCSRNSKGLFQSSFCGESGAGLLSSLSSGIRFLGDLKRASLAQTDLSRSLSVTVVLVSGFLGAVPMAAEKPEMPDGGSAEIGLLEDQLREAEIAFAASFAEGDMEAFAGFLDEFAVFMGRSTPLKGKEAIVERWTRMRGTGEAPFGWRPERVAIEASGQLGMSTGPVLASDGTWLSSFVSTWKRTPEGWRVVLDVGPKCPPPECPTPECPSQEESARVSSSKK